MDELKKFYEERFINEFDCPFDELTDDEKKALSSTWSFSAWKADQSIQKMKDELNKKLKKIGLKLRWKATSQ